MRIIQQQGPRVITTFESAEELNNENIEKFNQLMKGKKNFFFFKKINTNNTHIFIFLWRLWFFWFLQTNQSSNPFSWDTHCVSYFSSAKYRPARWKFLATQLHIWAYCTKTQNLTNLKKKKKWPNSSFSKLPTFKSQPQIATLKHSLQQLSLCHHHQPSFLKKRKKSYWLLTLSRSYTVNS